MLSKVLISLAAVGICIISMAGTSRQSSSQLPTVVDMQEASGTTTYKSETSHVLRVTYQMPQYGGGVTPAAVASTGSSTNPTTTTSTSTSTTSGTSSGSTGSSGQSFSFAVDASAAQYMTDDTTGIAAVAEQLQLPPSTYQGSVNGTPVNTSVLWVQVQQGDRVTLRTAATGQAFNTYFIWKWWYTDSNGDPHSFTYWWVLPNTTTRTNVSSISVDSRKAFGQPNTAGELPGDANASAANINFSNWTYNGGLFAGNADYLGSQDLSGTARLQAILPSPATTPVFQTLTLLALGGPPAFPGLQNGAYANLTGWEPSTSGLNTTLSSATWANAWPLTGTQDVGPIDFTPGGTTYSTFPEYANFEFPGSGSSLVVIGCSNESSVVSGETSMWEYFASPYYITSLASANLTQPLSAPLNDALPRVWSISLGTPAAGSYGS